MEQRVALAIIAKKRTGSHSTGSWHREVAPNIGDFFKLEDANVFVQENEIEVSLSKSYNAYYLNKDFNRIIIKNTSYRSYTSLPTAYLYLEDDCIAEYSPYDWYSEYLAYKFCPKKFIDTINEVRTIEYNNLIITTDGGLYRNVRGCGAEYLLDDMECIHGLL